MDDNSSSRVSSPMTWEDFIWGKQYAVLRRVNSPEDHYEDYLRFNNDNRSLGVLLIVFMGLSLAEFPTFAAMFSATTPLQISIAIACAVVMAGVFISMWSSFYYLWLQSTQVSNRFTILMDWLHPHCNAFTVMGTTIVYAVRLFMRINGGDCGDRSSFLSRWDCNPDAGESGLPLETTLAMMLSPTMLSVIMREVDSRIMFLSWAIVLVSLTIGMVIAEANRYVVLLVLYIFPSLAILSETYRHNRNLFLVTLELKKTLKERDENADQVHATEMRHMIANVAHDLKTPLTSFLSGIELISEVALDCQKKVSENDLNPSYLLENVLSILNCVANIRNTNSFMLMTINRCIDYTKASKGLKLVPKYETIDVLETLSLPLLCMRDIQQRVRIMLQPIPKEVCSHIITDKQWLQENILCLLSNAVKYSSEGTVTVTVRLVSPSEQDLENQQIELRIRQKALANSPGPLMTAVSVLRRSLSSRASAPVSPYQVELPNSSLIADDSCRSFPSSNKDDDPAGSKGHRSIIAQALSNLSRESSHREGANTVLLRIEIEDTGIGLSEEAMANLFNPFKQAQRLAGGTGLGLYSLARRLEALNGYYGVDHRRDGEQGSMFWFSIPYRPDRVSAGSLRRSIFPRRQDGLMTTIAAIKDATEMNSVTISCHSAEPASNRMGNSREETGMAVLTSQISAVELFGPPSFPSTPAAQQNNSDCPKLDVLIVDDSPAIVKMTSMMLRRLGHNISIAENGDAALKKIWERLDATKTPFDVVLMDLQMPVMDGLEATRRLRAFELSMNVPSSSAGSVSKRSIGPRRASQEAVSRTSFLTDSSASQIAFHQFVIGVSANSDHETMQDALDAGVDAFMAKPFSIETFYDTYEKVKVHNNMKKSSPEKIT